MNSTSNESLRTLLPGGQVFTLYCHRLLHTAYICFHNSSDFATQSLPIYHSQELDSINQEIFYSPPPFPSAVNMFLSCNFLRLVSIIPVLFACKAAGLLNFAAQAVGR